MGIYVDQTGYPVHAPKFAIATIPGPFQLFRLSSEAAPGSEACPKAATTDQGVCVLSAVTTDTAPREDASSGDQVWQIDFSACREEGTFFLRSKTGEVSVPFPIKKKPYTSLKQDLLKAFYFQRCGCALTTAYAGPYTHAACHTAPAIFLEDYRNHRENPATFDMTGGWHDAGDFGRYSTAAAVALAHLLYAYELFPESFKESLSIPESGNGMPDILNECLYELKWLRKMQAPDGGVYHKLTAFSHADFIMPQEDHSQFLIYPVSSMATADFAAVMALASRIYRPFLPDFAEDALAAARRSFDWLQTNPYIGFRNPEGSNTGEYDDVSDEDERLWAAAELLRSDPVYHPATLTVLEQYAFSDTLSRTDFGWTDVSGLALFPLLFPSAACSSRFASLKTDDLPAKLPPQAQAQLEKIREEWKHVLLQAAAQLLALQKENGYRLAMAPEDFVWGSNMVVCNRSILFILASLITEGETSDTCRQAALEQLHYLLGRNALDISYVTGHGAHAFRNPHNRPTFADGIDLPMPGWVSGGPNKAPCDEKALALLPAGTPPMKCFVDEVESYSTNEITIYWNSPAVFMAAFFDRD